MPRTVYLIIYNSPLFPAHWSLWIPQTDNPDVGKRLHATGDAHAGFEIAFERNYILSQDSRSYQVLQLAEVLDHHVVDVVGDGSSGTDQIACDFLEEVALSVPAPGRSLVSATAQGLRQRLMIQNCQTWLRDVVAALIQNGVMSEEALQVVDSAPKN